MDKNGGENMFKPNINKDIILIPSCDSRVFAFNKKSKMSFSLGCNECKVLRLLDGTKSIDEVHNQCGEYSYSDIKKLIHELSNIGLIDTIDNSKLCKKNNMLVRLITFLLNYKKGFCYPDKNINPHNILFKVLYFFVMYLSVPIFLLGLFLSVFMNIVDIKYTNSFKNTALMIIIFIVSVSLHELAHMVVAKKNGASIAEVGLGINFFIPRFYSSILGMSYIDSKMKRLSIISAGIFANLNLAGIGLIVSFFVMKSSVLYIFQWLAIINIFLVIMNSVFFIKLDGYFILTEIINDKKLKENSSVYLRHVIIEKIFNKNSKDQTHDFTFGNKIFYATYGCLDILFKLLIAIVFLKNIFGLFTN